MAFPSIKSENELSTTFHRIYKRHFSLNKSQHKAWYPNALDATFYRTGNTHPLPPRLDPIRHNFHQRHCCHPLSGAPLESQDYCMALFRNAGRARGWVMQPCIDPDAPRWTHRCASKHNICVYTCTYIRQCSASTCAYSFARISSGHLLCSPHLHIAEFLWRWSCILATIQSTTQKYRWELPETVPISSLFRGWAWSNWGVGRVQRGRYELYLHGCNIV